jgi:hypothetical protein
VDGSRQLEVLLPLVRRPGRFAELRRRCADAGVQCEIRRGTEVSKWRRVAMLTVPANGNEQAISALDRWTYVQLGTRLFDRIQAEETRRQQRTDRGPHDTTWTSREFKFVVGQVVKGEFLDGVEELCRYAGVRCESRVERKRLALTVVIDISGPSHAVDSAADVIKRWQARFGIVTGGG